MTTTLPPEIIEAIEKGASAYLKSNDGLSAMDEYHRRYGYIAGATAQALKAQVLVAKLEDFLKEALKVHPSDMIVDTQQFIIEIETALKQYNGKPIK